jgi:prefoldin subunit 5
MLGKIINRFVNASVYKHISSLESRVDELEMENVNTTNALYELENRIQSKLDKIQPVVYNIVNKDKDV